MKYLKLANLATSFIIFFAAAQIYSQEMPTPHVEVGNSHAKSGNYSQALNSLNVALAKDPNNARAYKLRGHVYFAMQDYDRAFQDLNKVVMLSPSSPNAYADRAIAYSKLNQHGAALMDVEKALALKPDSHFAKAVREQILSNAAGQ